MKTEPSNPQPGAYDQDVERLSEDLKHQARRAKARISERYGALVEARSFRPDADQRQWRRGS